MKLQHDTENHHDTCDSGQDLGQIARVKRSRFQYEPPHLIKLKEQPESGPSSKLNENTSGILES
ncbi:MAG: hypothetical protein P1U39_09005 [Legionellaceae bacterium]|nr:hypothetical protein [Legionellaceae bacterium]